MWQPTTSCLGREFIQVPLLQSISIQLNLLLKYVYKQLVLTFSKLDAIDGFDNALFNCDFLMLFFPLRI